MLLRTVKSCGPDASVVGVKSFGGTSARPGADAPYPKATEARKPDTPGRARYKPSNHCAGNVGCPPLNLYARVRFLLHLAHGTAGAARIRHSPRPLISRRETACTTRAHRAAGTRNDAVWKLEPSCVVPANAGTHSPGRLRQWHSGST